MQNIYWKFWKKNEKIEKDNTCIFNSLETFTKNTEDRNVTHRNELVKLEDRTDPCENEFLSNSLQLVNQTETGLLIQTFHIDEPAKGLAIETI